MSKRSNLPSQSPSPSPNPNLNVSNSQHSSTGSSTGTGPSPGPSVSGSLISSSSHSSGINPFPSPSQKSHSNKPLVRPVSFSSTLRPSHINTATPNNPSPSPSNSNSKPLYPTANNTFNINNSNLTRANNVISTNQHQPQSMNPLNPSPLPLSLPLPSPNNNNNFITSNLNPSPNLNINLNPNPSPAQQQLQVPVLGSQSHPSGPGSLPLPSPSPSPSTVPGGPLSGSAFTSTTLPSHVNSSNISTKTLLTNLQNRKKELEVHTNNNNYSINTQNTNLNYGTLNNDRDENNTSTTNTIRSPCSSEASNSSVNSQNNNPPQSAPYKMGSSSSYSSGKAVSGSGSGSGSNHSHVTSDSEWEEAIILRDGRRYPLAEKEKHVGLIALFSLIYFCVASGPYGIEESVRAAGTGWTCLALLTLPWIEHLPMGLLNCELASAMPQNGGYIIWISRAFGNFWGFQRGWWSWTGGLIDSSLYSFLFVSYFNQIIGAVNVEYFSNAKGSYLHSFFHFYLTASGQILLRIFAIMMVTISNFVGLQLVGVISVVFAALTLAPFFVITISGLEYSHPVPYSSLLSFESVNHVEWGLFFSALLWVGSGWDSPGTVAGDVKAPKKTYPRAVFLAVAAVTVSNFFPALIAMRVHKDDEMPSYLTNSSYISNPELSASSWDATQAFWAVIANQIGGSTLWCFVTFCAVITSLGLLNLLVTSSSWSLYALALPGLLDLNFITTLHSYFRTPHVCILLNSLLLCVCAFYSFSGLLQIAMALNMIGLSIEACSLIWLRVTEPRMKRPYRIPLNTLWLTVCMIPHFLITIILLLTIEPLPQYIVMGIVALGFLAYFLTQLFIRIQLAGIPPPSVDLQNVFQGIENTSIDDLPDLGLRFSVVTDVLPDGLGGNVKSLNSEEQGLDPEEEDFNQTIQPSNHYQAQDNYQYQNHYSLDQRYHHQSQPNQEQHQLLSNNHSQERDKDKYSRRQATEPDDEDDYEDEQEELTVSGERERANERTRGAKKVNLEPEEEGKRRRMKRMIIINKPNP